MTEICNECFTLAYLETVEACADYDCCHKYICRNGCTWKCHNCSTNYDTSDNLVVTAMYDDEKYPENKFQYFRNTMNSIENTHRYYQSNELSLYLPKDVCKLIVDLIDANFVEALVCQKCRGSFPNVKPHAWYGMSLEEWDVRYG